MKNMVFRIIVLVIFISIMLIVTSKRIEFTSLDIISDLSFEYNEKIELESLLSFKNGKLDNNTLLDTTSLGEHSIKIEYSNKKNKFTHEIKYNVVDTTAPILMGGNTITIKKGDKSDLAMKLLCADNYDKRPNCVISGDYNINKVGEYSVKYIASDTSNNVTEKDIKIIVKNSITTTYADTIDVPINDVITKHKTDKTMIGIDVSDWQGDIDFNKAKEAGVEFVIIRIGYGHTVKDNVLKYDDDFKTNLKKAKETGLLVGLYFYSYAHNEKEAIEQANWILDSLNGETLELGISFDWEIWSKFNSYNISITDLNNIAISFLSTIEKAGYKGMLYGSCSYLERMWNLPQYKTWLAHYAKETDYTKEYYVWQLTNAGKVNGIKGYVDLDILYK